MFMIAMTPPGEQNDTYDGGDEHSQDKGATYRTHDGNDYHSTVTFGCTVVARIESVVVNVGGRIVVR